MLFRRDSFMRIILASDGSEHSMKAAAQVRWLAGLESTIKVTILYVLPRPVTLEKALSVGAGLDPRKYNPEFVKRAEEVLATTTAALELPEDRITQRVLIGAPAEVICDVARDENANLIVMGTRGEGLVQALLLGSTSNRVTQLAHCPVLLAR